MGHKTKRLEERPHNRHKGRKASRRSKSEPVVEARSTDPRVEPFHAPPPRGHGSLARLDAILDAVVDALGRER